jgi:uncharacterized membrane protein
VTQADSTDRVENPHRVVARSPLLRPHRFRPATFGAGVTLTALGAAFTGQQLGVEHLGARATVVMLVLAVAALLIAVAIGWSRRAGRSELAEDPGGSPL